jgi:aryl-alcohol dehydrogenase-like predicted oxidoreductase
MWEAGITMLDTAHCYGEDNERIPGEWVKSRGVRDRFVMLAKGAHPDGGGKRCNPTDITKQLRESLDRMQFDSIDLYVLHRDDPDVPVGEIVDCLDEHVRAGRIHAFGGSNWTFERLKAANEYAAVKGRTPFAVSSPNFSLAVAEKPMWDGCVSIQNPDQTEARAWYRKTNMAVVAWSSIARGFLSGKFTSVDFEQKKNGFEGCMVHSYAYPENFRRLDRLGELAREKGVTVPQLALGYVLNYPLNLFALVGGCTPAEIRGILPALDVLLTPTEMAWLNLERETR